MPNTILTPNVIANEALMVLKNNLVMANLVHRDYENEFVKVGDTVTARRPSKFVAKNFTGAVDPQDLNEGGVPVKMDRLRDVTVQITSKEMSLDLRDFSAQVIEPAMTAIASASPIIRVLTVLEVGARCIGQASRSTEISSTAFAARPSGDVGLPVIASSAIDLSSRRGIIRSSSFAPPE